MDTKKLFLFDGKQIEEDDAIKIVRGIIYPCARFLNQQQPDARVFLSPYLFEGDDVELKLLLLFTFRLWSEDNIHRLLQQDLRIIEYGYLKWIFSSPFVKKHLYPRGNFDYFLSQVKQSDNAELIKLVNDYQSRTKSYSLR